MHIPDRAIPIDSTVVLVGANGYVAVETCEKLLQAGYRVRGTVRNVDHHRIWMHALFDAKWPDKFELVQVADFEEEGAFEEAFKGASGVIYPSMPVIFDANPTNVLDPLIRGVVNALQAAARAGPYDIRIDTFNHQAIHQVRNGPVVASFERKLAVYSAGRTLAEQAFWGWVKSNDPPFVANCIVPDGQFGRVLDVNNLNTGPTSSTGQLIRALRGEWEGVGLDLAFISDVQDTARLLVAAVASRSIDNERIFSYYVNRTWNDLRHKVRELFPDRPELVTGEDQCRLGRDVSAAPGPIARAEEILRTIGQAGFTSEDQIIRDFVNSVFLRRNTQRMLDSNLQ
ncbi:putative aldehyde reductase 2 [Aspergillus uvarum CBS 121591]|uniref:Putative aldehyde reductase 2 n=1 Tax=Aspergillus uvarum CBS 121591 TaxID=1448315 RepID=A0A319BVJ0_9EURO|nr:putative aldehyde reductase 2 [Aspergillus uvarum CBS 121591]PYH75559.1 putative aldehyde reductase 2 [Aspergillus uvarum CBS 121591]